MQNRSAWLISVAKFVFPAPEGMRVKLRSKLGECWRHGIAKPRVQETATAGSGTLGSRMSLRPALEGRHSPVCFALPGLDLTRPHPGLRPLRALRPGLCCTELSALVTIPVSLTRMPGGAEENSRGRAFFAAPRIGCLILKSPGRGERPYMTMLPFAPSGLFHYCFLPGVCFAHPWLFSSAPPGLGQNSEFCDRNWLRAAARAILRLTPHSREH